MLLMQPFPLSQALPTRVNRIREGQVRMVDSPSEVEKWLMCLNE